MHRKTGILASDTDSSPPNKRRERKMRNSKPNVRRCVNPTELSIARWTRLATLRRMKFLLALPLALCLIGCATKKHGIDWQTRVGSYTYDQAVSEMGPPDKESKLSEGTRVSEWHLKERGGMNLSFGLGSYSRYSGVGVGQDIGTFGGGHDYLRLVFRPDGILKSSERVVH
jgi:hypothetical protein